MTTKGFATAPETGPDRAASHETGRRSGFAMTLEAACSLLLLAFSLSLLPYFALPAPDAPDFFLCSDAALLLAKTSSFSDASLLSHNVVEMEALSGMCISAESSGASAQSGCAGEGAERHSFSLPFWGGGRV